jgi:hypothetical protein
MVIAHAVLDPTNNNSLTVGETRAPATVMKDAGIVFHRFAGEVKDESQQETIVPPWTVYQPSSCKSLMWARLMG